MLKQFVDLTFFQLPLASASGQKCKKAKALAKLIGKKSIILNALAKIWLKPKGKAFVRIWAKAMNQL